MNWNQADEKLGSRTGRKLENNTYLERLGSGDIGVRLHSTYVVTIHKDGTYTLCNGGWQTVTTKDRINDYSPAQLFQEKGNWFLQCGDRETGTRYEFENGMKIDASGNVLQAT